MAERFSEALPLEPCFVERVWGGSRLAELFGKRLPPGKPIGESWEASDVGGNVSSVADGPYRGRTVRRLVEEFGKSLTGSVPLPEGRLPLLFKLIDAREDLSIQLHPRDEDIPPGSNDRGKEEAWYILDADPGARLIHGLRAGVAAEDLFRAVDTGGVEECVEWYEVRPGEVYYVPPGTVHAIGKGIVLAEIQQSSDTTYRLYDWGRVGLDGKPRALHIEEARRVPFAPPVPCPYGPEKRGGGAGRPDLLLRARHFRLRRYGLERGEAASGSLVDRFVFLFTVEGEATLENDGGRWVLQRGVTWLLPAGLGDWSISAGSSWTGLWMEPEREIEERKIES